MGVDTSIVTTMRYMFTNCSALQTIDLSGLDSGKVTNMSNMFRGGSELETIYSDETKFVENKVTSGDSMFSNCSKLVGGAGTAYDRSRMTHTMAHVDTEDNPGYFTAKE